MALDFTWSTHDDLGGSDHFPIFLSGNTPQEEESYTKLNFNKANWPLFSQLCSSTLDDFVLSKTDPTNQFSTLLCEAAGLAIPTKTIQAKRFPRVPWFTEICKEAIKLRKKAQRKFFKNPNLENILILKREKAKAKLIIKQAKRDSWKNYVSKINSQTPIKNFWEAVSKIKGKKKP